jgi:cytochrome c553
MVRAWPLAVAVAYLLGFSASVAAAAPAAADVRAGERLATSATGGAAACASCHGQRGEGMANFPRLAGLGTAYLRSQLEAFASGTRKNPIMQPIAQALSPEQRSQVAAYFSSLPKPKVSPDRTARAPSETGAWLATRGRWEDSVPACAQCHGPGGMGVGDDFPPLAAQPAAYLAEQLRAWQSGARHPGPLGLMETIARKLSAADIQAVSDYYAGLAGAAAGGTAAAGGKPTGRTTP